MEKLFFDKNALEIINDPSYKEPSKQVFGNFMFQNELAILFGDTNSAKSILAVDACISFTTGINYWGVESMSQIDENSEAFYYDLEQSVRQFGKRYSNAPLADNRFFRTAFTVCQYGIAGVDDLIEDIKTKMKKEVQQLIVIDNLQCILTQNFSPTRAKYLMQNLKVLKELNSNISIILVAHTTKRNMGHPIDQNNLAGSKVLANFADSIFAIAASSRDSSSRYIKQIKSREVAKMDEVAICEINDYPYLHLEFMEMDSEDNHLAKVKSGRLSKIDDFIREHVNKMASKGMSIRDIADELGLSKSHIHRIVSGQA